jgi:MFS family permease
MKRLDLIAERFAQVAGRFSHQRLTTRETATLVGASLLSAGGSLPWQLMPLIIAALVVDSRTSIAQAGWVASAVLLGQLSASLAVPALGVQIVSRGFAIAVALALLLGLAASTLGGIAALYTGWFLIGGCCGVLQYLGVVAASIDSRPAFAFSLRLSIVLMLAGTVVGALQATNVFVSYFSTMAALGAVFVPLLATGIALYDPPRPNLDPAEQYASDRSAFRKFSGLGAIYLLFVGQVGFLAYAVQSAMDRGMAIEEAAWAVAAMKIVSGAWLLYMAQTGFQTTLRPRFLELGGVLAASVVVVSYTGHLVGFFLGLIAFEIAFNTLVPRLQAKVILGARQFAGRWLTAALLLGAASGPPLHGAAISAGAGWYFICFAVLSALLPSLWAKLSASRTDEAAVG